MKLPPVLFLVGKDSYQAQLRLDDIRAEIFPKGSAGLNDDSFDVKARRTQEIIDLCNTMPMLSAHRLIILRGIEKMNEADQSAWCEYIAKPSPQTVLVGLAEKLDKRTKLYKALDKQNFIHEVTEPKPRDMPAWIDRIAKRHNVTILPEAKMALIESVGTNLSLMNQQVEKLALYAHPEKTVTAKSVAELVLDSTGDSIFAWTDQVMDGRLNDAIATLDFLFETGNPPLVMVAMLARHVRILLKAKDLVSAKAPQSEYAYQLGVPPFAVGRYVEQARKHPQPALVGSLAELARLDHDLKSTGLPPKLLVERTIRTISTPRI